MAHATLAAEGWAVLRGRVHVMLAVALRLLTSDLCDVTMVAACIASVELVCAGMWP